MNHINYKILLVWLLCALVVVPSSASSMATRSSTSPSQSLSAVTAPVPVIVKGTLSGNQALTDQLTEINNADAPAIVGSPWSSFDLAINDGRLAHFTN
jgi:hypothetical protein